MSSSFGCLPVNLSQGHASGFPFFCLALPFVLDTHPRPDAPQAERSVDVAPGPRKAPRAPPNPGCQTSLSERSGG